MRLETFHMKKELGICKNTNCVKLLGFILYDDIDMSNGCHVLMSCHVPVPSRLLELTITVYLSVCQLGFILITSKKFYCSGHKLVLK